MSNQQRQASSSRPRRPSRIEGFFDPRTYLDRDKYLARDQLNRLEIHKYNSEGSSMAEPYLQPFWKKIVTLLPLWLAPNLITLIGLLANLSSSIICFVLNPTATSAKVPEERSYENEDFLRYLFIFNAVTLFFYQTLDAIDGKQARRTNTSSPLGELFDHGMDSISVILVSNVTFICFGCGKEPGLMFIFCLICNIGYYISHWSAYITGKLQFGRFDVTEGQLFSIFAYIITYYYGQELWEIDLLYGAKGFFRHTQAYFILKKKLFKDYHSQSL